MIKQTSPSTDAQGITIFAPTTSAGNMTYPILGTSSGSLCISSGIDMPTFDYVDFTNLTGILFKRGGSSGNVVATISINGTTLART